MSDYLPEGGSEYEYDEPPPRQMMPATKIMLVLLGGCFAFAVVGLVVFAASLASDADTPDRPAAQAPRHTDDAAPPRPAPAPRPAVMTKAEFRQRVMGFKNYNGGRPWNGVNGRLRPGGGPGRTMSLEDYQRRLQEAALNPEVVAVFDEAEFTGAFGTPQRTSTQGDVLVWVWKCSDGTVNVIHKASATPGQIRLVAINDF